MVSKQRISVLLIISYVEYVQYLSVNMNFLGKLFNHMPDLRGLCCTAIPMASTFAIPLPEGCFSETSLN